MASFRKLPSGRWQVTVRTPQGKRITYTHPLKRACEVWAADRVAEFARGTYRDPRAAAITVADWYARWSAARVVATITEAKNTSHWRNHVGPAWGSWQLGAIGRLDVQAWVRRMDDAGVGAHTIEASRNLLSAIMQGAVSEGLVSANPCRGVKSPPTAAGRLRYFTHAECSLILDALDEPHRTFCDLGMTSGLRWGELAGLHGDQVDWGHARLTVTNVLTRTGIRTYPKSKRSNRVVPFPTRLLHPLAELNEASGGGLLFRSPNGAALDDNHWRARVWRPALERAGVPYAPPHTLRHTAASHLVQAGVDLYRVQALLGHESFATTSKYAHLAPDDHGSVRSVWGDDR